MSIFESYDEQQEREEADRRPPATAPAGVIPLSWAESQDELKNSRFEALSHLCAGAAYWRVFPTLEANAVAWRAEYENTSAPLCEARALADEVTFVCEQRFTTSGAAMAECERAEVHLGGAERAPRVPVEYPDEAAPLVTDEHGFSPTRTIRSRWSRNEGRLYLDRVWAKPDAPEQTIDKQLVGEEYEAALPAYITQQMVQALVANITRPGGWVVPLTWSTIALGQVRLECEVHFVAARGLHWAKDWKFGTQARKEDFKALTTPSHGLINSIVAEELARRKAEFDRTLATTSEDDLRRSIAKNARKLGIDSPIPEPEGALSGNVLPATLEDMQRAGVDLRGASLK